MTSQVGCPCSEVSLSMLVTDCADSYLLVPFYAFVDSVGLQLAGRPS